MAFNFLGTLSLEQLSELRNFLIGELETIDNQINFLIIEQANLENILAQLIKADESFGGSLSKQLYDTQLPDVRKIKKQEDSNSAVLIDKAKRPFIENIKYKREKLEFKAKKVLDMLEQTKEKIDRKGIAKSDTLKLLDRVSSLNNKSNSNHIFATTVELKNYFKGIS